MKKSFLVSIFSFFVLIAFSSCGDNGTNPSSNDEIWPLKVGNYWKYDLIDYDTLGNVVGTDSSLFKIDTVKLFNNEKFYMVEVGIGNHILGAYALKNQTDGVYGVFRDGVSGILREGVILKLKYPISIGEKFNSIDGLMTLDSKNYLYSTNIGTFSCYQYKMASTNSIDVYYYAPGAGQIAREMYKKTQSGRFYFSRKYILREYKVN